MRSGRDRGAGCILIGKTNGSAVGPNPPYICSLLIATLRPQRRGLQIETSRGIVPCRVPPRCQLVACSSGNLPKKYARDV